MEHIFILTHFKENTFCYRIQQGLVFTIPAIIIFLFFAAVGAHGGGKMANNDINFILLPQKYDI